MIQHKVLFVCIHNSARSQMAEAYLNKFGEGRIVAESSGLEPGVLNPIVVKAMKEEGDRYFQQQDKEHLRFLHAGKNVRLSHHRMR